MQKIRFNLKLFALIFSCLSACAPQPSMAQSLTVIKKKTIYRQQIKKDSLQKLVNLSHWIPTIVIDLRYATKENFTREQLYPKVSQTYARLAVVKALQSAADELAGLGYRLKVWDAYRPYSVTKKMWDLIGDERYVANPAKGSGHNRGLAIDLTLLKDGKEVAMGTEYDHFSDTAHHSFTQLSPEILSNRQLLRTTMEKHGFRALETEWWHYSWPNDRAYEVLDLSFKDLRKLSH